MEFGVDPSRRVGWLEVAASEDRRNVCVFPFGLRELRRSVLPQKFGDWSCEFMHIRRGRDGAAVSLRSSSEPIDLCIKREAVTSWLEADSDRAPVLGITQAWEKN